MRRLILLALLACPLFAQATNPACPAATGPAPHCVVLTWTAPAVGTGYNIYTGGTASGNCASVTASTCTKLGSAVSLATLTYTVNSSATLALAEGQKYYYVITTVNGSAESQPSAEVSAMIPFLVPSPPSSVSATAH